MTAGEQGLSAWWCEEVNSRHRGDDVRRVIVVGGGNASGDRSHARFVLPEGELFALPPGVELISQSCCPPASTACDTSDGDWRAVQRRR